MTFDEHHAALVAYLKVKVEARDWHGVRDAAVDIEILEARALLPDSNEASRIGVTGSPRIRGAQ